MDSEDHAAALAALHDKAGDLEEIIELNCWSIYCPEQDSQTCKHTTAQLRKTYVSEQKAVEIAAWHLQTSTKHQDDDGQQLYDEAQALALIEENEGCIKVFTEKWKRKDWLFGVGREPPGPSEPAHPPPRGNKWDKWGKDCGKKGKGSKHGGKGGSSSSSGKQSHEVTRYQPYEGVLQVSSASSGARGAEQVKTAANFIKEYVFEKTHACVSVC